MIESLIINLVRTKLLAIAGGYIMRQFFYRWLLGSGIRLMKAGTVALSKLTTNTVDDELVEDVNALIQKAGNLIDERL